jgi:hypothetical protein
MNSSAERSVAVAAVTIVAIIVGFLAVRAQAGSAHESVGPSNEHFTAREREEAFLSCLKTQADGCYIE